MERGQAPCIGGDHRGGSTARASRDGCEMGRGKRWRTARYAGAALGVAIGVAAGGEVRARASGEHTPAPGRAGLVERFLIPEPVPVPDAALDRAAALVRAQVEREAFPGAVLAAGNRALVQRVEAFGRTRWEEDAPAADPDATLYDLASLTKVVATTSAVMALVEDRRMALDAPVRRYLPRFTGEGRDEVTIRHLLTHTSGLRAGAVTVEGETPAAARRYLLGLDLALEPGADVLYSDIGFLVLWLAAEAAAGEPLPAYLRRRVWGPLGMTSTTVGVPRGCERCAPTLYLQEADEPYTGGSYDEIGRRLDGVAGSSGAFSTGGDLARFAAMIAAEGRLGDVRIYEPRTVRAFLAAQPRAGSRALGWEVYCREAAAAAHEPCGEVLAVGHTGVTGTSLWVDPGTGTWLILLSNRTYLPRASLEMPAFRRRVFRAISAEGG